MGWQDEVLVGLLFHLSSPLSTLLLSSQWQELYTLWLLTISSTRPQAFFETWNFLDF
jgi:hypothetical protein